MRRALRTGLILLALFARAHGEDPPAAKEATLRARGLAALPEILRDVESEDADRRLRARRLVRAIVLDHLAAHAPEGMRLVPGRLVISEKGVRMEGGFYLGRTEVTRGAFRAFAKKAGLKGDHWAEGGADLPVVDVTLEEARAFAKAHDARIPTRDELERAATAGHRSRFPWGDRFDPARVNSRESARGAPEPVDTRKEGRSPEGIADLVGNVAEWTETPAGKQARKYLIVGGSFKTPARARFETYRLDERHRLPDVGFRLACSLPPLVVPKGS